MKNKKKIIEIAIAIIIPLLVGGISSFLTMNEMESFSKINQPPLSPPSILFPIVWTILYILMGISSYFIYKSDNLLDEGTRKKCLILYIVQLVFNFFWSIIFFNLKMYEFAFVWLICLWGLILLLIINTTKLNKVASYLLIPYLLWVSFALYLNLGVAILN